MHFPTRENYLLDLILSDVQNVEVKKGAKIADHSCLIATLKDSLRQNPPVERLLWQTARADWNTLEASFERFNWQILEEGTVDEAVDVFYKRVNDEMGKSIPRKKSIRRKCDLPWLDEQAREAIKEKHEAEGTANYEVAAANCRQILRQSKRNYMDKIQDDLANLRRPWIQVALRAKLKVPNFRMGNVFKRLSLLMFLT